MVPTLETSRKDVKSTLKTSIKDVKSTLETSGKDVKSTLETSGKDVKSTLETSGKDDKLTFVFSFKVKHDLLEITNLQPLAVASNYPRCLRKAIVVSNSVRVEKMGIMGRGRLTLLVLREWRVNPETPLLHDRKNRIRSF
jgi:hypothetical protein